MPIGPDNKAYSVIARDDGSYAVEITEPAGLPRFAEGFKTKAEAEDWIFNRIERKGDDLPPYAGPPDSLPGHAPGEAGDE